ncbi:hypothetical protein BHM03_00044586 [Ensete ventricosum]|nr:hypothetical protein BHM03_00044586 [Ensete ventricosum]
MTSSDSSASIRLVPSVRSWGASQENPEASTSGISSGVPSLVDAKALWDMEVMKACHDFDLIMTEGSLVVIRERYNIPEEYMLHDPLPEQRPYNRGSLGLSISVDTLEATLRLRNFGGAAFRAATALTPKRPTEVSTPHREGSTHTHKWIKMLVGKHKSQRGEGSSRARSKGKESGVLGGKPTQPAYRHPKLMKELCGMTVHKDDEGYYTLKMTDLPP